MAWIAIVAIELGRAFAELLVLAGLGKAIVLLHRRAQTRCVHANLAGQRLERGRLDKIATRDEAAQAAPPRRDAAEPVFVDEFTVTDEGMLGTLWCERCMPMTNSW